MEAIEHASPYLKRLLSTRSSRWALLLVAWSLVGFLSAAHWHLFYIHQSPYTWWELLRIKAFLWYLWGVWTLLILWLGRLYRPEGIHAVRNVLVLVLTSIVSIMAYLVVYAIAVRLHLLWIGKTTPQGSVFQMLSFVLSTHSTFYFLAFWATLGVDYAAHFYVRLKERELKTTQLKAQLAEAQLESLKSRLHPHFLFNALNTISSLVYSGKKNEAYDTIAQLAELLRTSLRTEATSEVALEAEFEFANTYLDIARARFTDQLSVTLEMDDDTRAAAVPSLILQPLVENAVKHGLRDEGAHVQLRVSATRENGQVYIEVSDDGAGLPEAFELDQQDGFGLKSTQARLRSLYGEAASFSIQRSAPRGAKAVIAIPYRNVQEA